MNRYIKIGFLTGAALVMLTNVIIGNSVGSAIRQEEKTHGKKAAYDFSVKTYDGLSSNNFYKTVGFFPRMIAKDYIRNFNGE